MTTMEEAYTQAADEITAMWGETPEPCRYGHYECSTTAGGHCWNETVDTRTAEILARGAEERREFLKRLIEAEQDQTLIDVTTGKVLGKRRDIEG